LTRSTTAVSTAAIFVAIPSAQSGQGGDRDSERGATPAAHAGQATDTKTAAMVAVAMPERASGMIPAYGGDGHPLS
jgi:hypothetical protein